MGNKTSSTACQCLSPNHRPHRGKTYCRSHHSQSAQWLPPADNWASDNGLPYGWEGARDKQGKAYFINHVEKVTTRDDPRDDPDYVEPPKPREIALTRDPKLGFGFVAGSEKPVIVRFVTEGGPSEDKLLPGDQLIKINGEDIKKAPREYVIELVRSCKECITLTVCQPYTDNSTRKSALLTAAKKARLKNNPSRVRFAEAVTVNGAPVITPSSHESYIPFMPNVLKVFLENGQTKSFKYDNKTTVKDVLNSLQEKLNIKSIEHFALVLQNMKSPTRGRLSILQEHESLADIAARPGSQHFKCLFRVTFVPKDAYDLLRTDPTAFEYFYMQCCNDVVQERFASELKYDVALRLAALHIHQHAITSNMTGKISIKSIEKECGLDRFVPISLLDSMKGKDMRKMVAHYMKANQNLSAPGQKQLTALQAKLHYLKIISELRSFGGKCFMATLVDKKMEAMLLVGPKCGVSVVTNIKNNTLKEIVDFEQLSGLIVNKDSDTMQKVDLYIKENNEPEAISMLSEDVQDFVALVEGYHRVFCEGNKSLLRSASHPHNNNTDPNVPKYHNTHEVEPAPWSYTSTSLPDANQHESENSNKDEEPITKTADLSSGPPDYFDNKLAENAKEKQLEDVKEPVQPPCKPTNLRTSDIVTIKAPLASPDTSNISGSGSSESSINNEGSLETVNRGEQESHNGKPSSRQDELTDFSPEDSSMEDGLRDSDSLTGSSVSTVISRSCIVNESPVNGSQPGYDNRFSVTSFKTFSDPALNSSEEFDNSRLSQESNITLSDGDLSRHSSRSDAATDQAELKGLMRQDSSSETDTESSVCGSAEIEKTPLLGNNAEEELMFHDSQASPVPDYIQSESSDTDSVSTPTDSPSKGRLESLNVNPPPLHSERPQSFGLHSPDQLPRSESEFRAIATSFGLHSPDKVPVEFLHPSYNPRLFCDGGLYLDPDIIDLTLIPPPKTPDQEKLIDFSCTAFDAPPPGFTDENGECTFNTSADSGDLPPGFINDIPSSILEHIDQLVQNDEELGTQLAAMDAMLLHQAEDAGQNDKESGIESESDSGNETISSENVDYVGGTLVGDHMGTHRDQTLDTLNLDTDDIDAFIARVTVPPPPKDSPDEFELPPLPPGTRTSLHVGEAAFSPPPDLVREAQAGKRTSQADTSMDSDVFLPSAPASATWGKGVPSEQVFALDLEAEFAQYVIPPPPVSEDISLGVIPIVPPVDVKTPSPVMEYPPEPPLMTSERVEGMADKVKQQNSPKLKRVDSIERKKGSNVTALMKVFSNKPVMDAGSGTRDSPTSRRKMGSRESSVASDQGEGSPRLQISREGSMESEHSGATSPSKPRPPLPPKRMTSLEGSESAPASPVTSASANSPSIDSSIKSRLLWQAETKSADNSPVHKGKDFKDHIGGSTGTLNRPRRTPPPPPPRRSSMLQGSNSSGSLGDESGKSSPGEGKSRTLDRHGHKNRVDLASKRDYVNVNPGPSEAENTVSKTPLGKSVSSPPGVGGGGIKSELEKVLLARGSPKSQPREPKNSSPSDAPTSTPDVVAETSFKDDPVETKTKVKTMSSPASSNKTVEKKDKQAEYQPETIVIPKPIVDVSRIPRSNRERNGSFDRKEDLDTSASSTEEKPPGTTPSPRTYRSPSFSRKILMFDFSNKKPTDQADDKEMTSDGGSSDAYDSDSSATPSPQSVSVSSKGNAFSSSGQSKAYISPRSSPSVSRHSSFTKMAEKAASPLRSLFGGRNRALSSDSEGAASPSPQKIPSYRSSLPLTKPGARSMSASPSMQRKNGQKKGNNSGKVVYPLMSATSPETESPPPLPISTLQETCTAVPAARSNGESMTTFGKSTDSASPNSPKVARGPKLLTDSKIPPWKSTAAAAAAVSANKQPSSPLSQSGVAHVTQKHPNGSVHVGATSGEGKDKDSKAAATSSPSKQPSVIGYAAERIMSKKYQGDGAFTQASTDVDTLVKLVDDSLMEIKKPNFQSFPEEFAECKEILVTQARQFVTDSKLLVSSATQSREKLVENVNNSIHTLARMVYHCRLTMRTLPSNQAQNLAMRLKDVATAFKTTMNAANIAAGKPLNDPQMKLLMRQATSLAAILSTLMKTLKVLDNS